MYAITGITGQVGGTVARTLLAAGERVRAVVRDAEKGAPWAALGCELAVARMQDAEALARAFEGARGVFVLVPPVFDPQPGFPEAREVMAAVRQALLASAPSRVVSLSTVGAQAAEANLLSQHTLIEEALSSLPMSLSFLRPAWFMENARWDVASARDQGLIRSFLQPLDRAIPMVATGDVGRVAAELLLQPAGPRVVELEGQRLSPAMLAEAFGQALGRTVAVEAVPRARWEGLFVGQGMRHPLPRMRMLDGFNEGWIRFEGGDDTVLKGRIGFDAVLQELLA
jgi:uncharacterized protein YbjT (DUF2867 family)